jgi:hypothetical protein
MTSLAKRRMVSLVGAPRPRPRWFDVELVQKDIRLARQTAADLRIRGRAAWSA